MIICDYPENIYAYFGILHLTQSLLLDAVILYIQLSDFMDWLIFLLRRVGPCRFEHPYPCAKALASSNQQTLSGCPYCKTSAGSAGTFSAAERQDSEIINDINCIYWYCSLLVQFLKCNSPIKPKHFANKPLNGSSFKG